MSSPTLDRTATATIVPARPEASPVPIARPGVVESRNFCRAECPSCGWRGPGRRARSVAQHDGELHALTGCGI